MSRGEGTGMDLDVYLFNKLADGCDRPTITMDEPNAVRFTLPSMPVSVNGIYQVLFKQHRVELKPEARRWKSEAKQHMPPWKPESGTSFICIDVVFYYNFYGKNGALVEKDTHNYMKLLQDAVAERYDFKDSRVKRCPIDSRHAKKESVVVIVSEYNLEG